MIPASIGLALLSGFSSPAGAQHRLSLEPADSGNYWGRFALGAATSLLAHESAHILTSLALGFHPYLALDNARPTIFSGIDSRKYPHQQFLFSAAGLTTQAFIDELILDIPHSRGGAVERGLLAGGIGTTLFYVTIGRNGSVSDIAVMARTSSLSKTQLSLIFGGINAIQALRISRNPAYDHFFARPSANGISMGLRY
ncbi:MAG TPA: hypothetical protein VLJ83_05985 [Gemmatimonadaceae bacterium]|nr:hypothetical protein [Gemmatimonadaceae bacterium]